MKFSGIQSEMTLSPTEWILEKSRNSASTDIFAARSWLLTAKSMFPRSFSVQYEAYRLEYAEKNADQCSSLLEEMFQEFPSAPSIWTEIESLILALEVNETKDEFKKDLFSKLSPPVQQRMIIASAECQSDIAQQCKLMLVLMNRYPATVAQYGVPLAEKLVEEEKLESAGSPLNHPRRLLVCEVLPAICRSREVSVSHKHFYKWLQKAAEFYATYFTTDPKISMTLVGKIQQSWDDVEKLRNLISSQCGWEEMPESHASSLRDRMDHIKDLHRRSRTDLTGNISKKQVFYTAILLLFEAAAKYMEILEPNLYFDNVETSANSHILVVNWKDEMDAEENLLATAKKIKTEKGEDFAIKTSNAELKMTFLVARDAWNVLHSNESFDKDFSHLHRRWKMDRWTWLQLFLVDFYTYDNNYKNALSRLNNLMEQDVSKFRPQVLLRCHCQLVASYYANDHLLMACQSIMEALGHLPNPTPESQAVAGPSPSGLDNHTSDSARCSRINLVRLDFSGLLPFWINIFIKSLMKIVASDDEGTILGHVLVLSQYNWPQWQRECGTVVNMISSRSKYSYPIFFDYVIGIDILEEIAYLKTNSSCELVLLPDSPTSRQRVTRGVNKGACDDFKKAMKRQVRKSGDCLETLLRRFLTEQQDSLLNCLQSETAQEILEPMDIDI